MARHSHQDFVQSIHQLRLCAGRKIAEMGRYERGCSEPVEAKQAYRMCRKGPRSASVSVLKVQSACTGGVQDAFPPVLQHRLAGKRQDPAAHASPGGRQARQGARAHREGPEGGGCPRQECAQPAAPPPAPEGEPCSTLHWSQELHSRIALKELQL